MLYLLILLSIVALIFIFILICLFDKKDKPKPNLNPTWTGDEISSVFNLLKSHMTGAPDSLLQCCVSELSKSLSYKDFMAKSDEDKQISLMKSLGVKGKWADCFKQFIKQFIPIILKSYKEVCINCLIDKVETDNNPISFLDKDKTIKILIDAVSNCKMCS